MHMQECRAPAPARRSLLWKSDAKYYVRSHLSLDQYFQTWQKNTTLRSLINCTAHQKTAKLANTPVIAHLLRNLLYRSNNSRLCYLFAYNYCSLRYCGKQPKIKLKTFRPLRNEITKHQ